MSRLEKHEDHSIEVDRGLVQKLAGLPLLSSLDPHDLLATAAEFQWFSLLGGETLFQRGDRDDSLYVVLSGRLGAFIIDEDGKEVLIRQMSRGETVGELALLSGQPRSASVVALRDSEVVCLSKSNFSKLVQEHPRALSFITDILVRRLLRPPRLKPALEAPRTLAIISLDRDDADAEFARSLCVAFKDIGMKSYMIEHEERSRPLEWFNTVEENHEVVIYQTDFETSAWTRLCLRQADRVVLLGSATRTLAEALPAAELALENPQRAPVELVLYREDGVAPSQTLALINRFGGAPHHHLRAGEVGDLRRLARMISGRAIGLVLSGGAARGISHICVIRALHEADIEPDLFGGTSIGSIVAAGAAIGWSDDELTTRMREAFAGENPLNDYTLPLVSLVRGRKTSNLLRRHFGNQQIEDCPYTYFAASTNLSSGRLHIHRTGPMWRALRASIAIPGILPPVIEGSDILVDGGVLNNLPFDVMMEMRRGPVIASDLSISHGFKATIDDLEQRTLWELMSHARKGTPNIATLLVASGTMSSYAQVRDSRDHVALLIQPVNDDLNMLDWHAFDRMVETGYRRTIALLEERGDDLLRTLSAKEKVHG
jgi:NTE family protein